MLCPHTTKADAHSITLMPAFSYTQLRNPQLLTVNLRLHTTSASFNRYTQYLLLCITYLSKTLVTLCVTRV